MPALNLDFRDWWHWGIELLRGDRHRSIYGRRRAELIWSIAAVAVTLVAVLVAAGVYVYAPGHYRVKAEFAEAGQISPGDSVRVAGVPVGTVKRVVLDSDHVDVEMAVRWGTVLGDQTRADVKMLTLVGGSFIDLTTAGRDAAVRTRTVAPSDGGRRWNTYASWPVPTTRRSGSWFAKSIGSMPRCGARKGRKDGPLDGAVPCSTRRANAGWLPPGSEA